MCIRDSVGAYPLPREHLAKRLGHDTAIQQERNMVRISHIVGEFLLPGDGVAPVHLGKPRQTGTDLVPAGLKRIVTRQIVDKQRTRPHDRHVALEDVPKLGQLVQAGGAQPPAERGEPHLVGKQGPFGIPFVRHGSELADAKQPPVLARAHLAENDRPAQPGGDQHGHRQKHGREQHQPHDRKEHVQQPFDAPAVHACPHEKQPFTMLATRIWSSSDMFTSLGRHSPYSKMPQPSHRPLPACAYTGHFP